MATSAFESSKSTYKWENHQRGQMKSRGVQPTNVLEVPASLLDSIAHSLLTLTNPDTRVVVLIPQVVNFRLPFAAMKRSHLLVWLVLTLGIANLGLQVALLLLEVVLNLDYH